MKLIFILFLSISSNVNAEIICMKPTGNTLCARDEEADQKCSANTYAWIKESCLDRNTDHLSNSIIDTPSEAALKIEPSLFKRFSTEQIAQSLLFRKIKSEKSAQDPSTPIEYNIYKNSQVILQFKSDYLDSIIQKGFLNQFQTNTTLGDRNLPLRRQAESYLMNISLEKSLSEIQATDTETIDRLNELQPKYAYLAFTKARDGLHDNNFSAQYGNLFVKFNDKIKKRTGFSNGDSLNELFGRRKRLDGPFVNFTPYSTFKAMNMGGYYEAQVWGPLTLSDADYILVDCFEYSPPAPVADQVITTLKKRGLKTPVYSCKFNEDQNITFPQPKDKLFPLD